MRGGLLPRRIPEGPFLFLCTGYGRDADGGGSGAAEGLRAGAGRGAGGVNVVDEQHVAIGNGCGVRRDERAAEILAPLMRGETGLALGSPMTRENIGSQMQAQIGAAPAEEMDRAAREEFRLVEAALAAFAGIERDGHDDQIGGQIGDGENGIGEERAEALCQRLHAVVFQQVEQSAQLIAVEAPRDGLLERRRRGAAGAAKGVIGGAFRVREQGFAAAVAKRAGLRGEMIPAGSADGQEGETGEREAADAAIGGEEYGGEAVEGSMRRTSEHADHRAPGRVGGWRDFGRQRNALTAEDAPRSGGRNAES